MVRYIKESVEDDFDEFDFGDDNAEWYEGVDVPKECIKGATLLSKEEYEEYRDNISELKKQWWLRSPGRRNNNVCTIVFGTDIYDKCDVDYEFSVVRPALILSLQSSNLNFNGEDKFEFGGHLFIIVSNEFAICDDFIGKGCFREDRRAKDANIYEKSDVKKFVDNWFNEAYRNYEG